MFCLRDVLVLLLWSMLNDKQPFEMRCAVLYCFQCYLYKNDAGKMKIIQQLLPLEKEGKWLNYYLNEISNYYSCHYLYHRLNLI